MPARRTAARRRKRTDDTDTMITYEQTQSEIPEAERLSICVIGVGGAGCNVLDRLALDGMPEADLICMNSDQRAIANSMAGSKIQLGADLTRGLGAGGDPDLGRQAASASEPEIRAAVEKRDLVFICTGLGGGTGSGASPFVAQAAREAGAFVVVFAVLPFPFEGQRRSAQANDALDALRQSASALMTFENGRMGELVLPKEGIQGAFGAADEVLAQSIRAVAGIVLRPGLIRIGLDELVTALQSEDARCLFGYGKAKGENRAQEALSRALKSPLLDRGQMLSDAASVLVHVAGGRTMTLYEVELLMTELAKHVSSRAQILFGTSAVPALEDEMAVTVISSLAARAEEPAAAASEPAASDEQEPETAAEHMISAEAILQDDEEEDSAPPDIAAPPAEPAAEAPAPELPAEPEFEPEPAAAQKPVAEPEPASPPNDDDPVRIETPAARQENEFLAPDPVAAELLEPELDDEEADGLAAEDVPSPSRSVSPFRAAEPSRHHNGSAIHLASDDEDEPEPAAAAPSEDAFAEPPAPAGRRFPGFGRRRRDADDDAGVDQPMLELEPSASRGRFDKAEPTIVDGEDLDVPTFLRKRGE